MPVEFNLRPTSPARSLCWLLASAVCCSILCNSANAQTGQGIDVVMLVDVSSSMLMSDGTGTDKHRLRWDAVKIVLDLLCEEDRILITPFNSQCPARFPDKDPAGKFVPGKLSQELQKVDDASGNKRAQLESVILSFVHSNITPPHPNDGEYNADVGGTGILGALRFAKQKLQASRALERNAFVILLTDGGQDILDAGVNLNNPKENDDVIHDNKTWKTDPNFTYFLEARIPVYALGLGLQKDAKEHRFLEELAEIADDNKQNAQLISSNLELVDKFRDLIWSLRDCWIQRIKLDDKVALFRSSKIGNATDVGLLAYQEGANPLPGRKLFAPQPALRLTWEGATTTTPAIPKPRTGKLFPGAGPSGHAFYYFDGRMNATDPMMGALFEQQLNLQLRIEPGAPLTNRPIEGFLVKRLPVQFRIQNLQTRYLRHQPIPLQIVLQQDKPHFKASQFRVQARLIAKSGPAPDSKGKPFALTHRDELGLFEAPMGTFLAATDLPHSEALLDDVSLEVSVREADAPEGGFILQLPARNLKIENTIELQPPSALHIQYSPVAKPGECVVHTRYPMRGDLALGATIDYPKSIDTKLFNYPAAKDITIAGVTAGASAQVINLHDGELNIKGSVAISPIQPPEKTAFKSGEIRLVSHDKPPFRLRLQGESALREIVSIPVHLLLGNVALKVMPEFIPPLVVGPDKSAASAKFEVGVVGKSEKELGALKVEVSLDVAGQAIPFAKDELWLQAESDRVTPGVTKLQLLENNEKLLLHFRPDAARHKELFATLIGTHTCILKVEGGGLKGVERKIDLQVDPPRLEVQQEPHDFLRSPGKFLVADYALRMRWLPGGVLPFQLTALNPKEIHLQSQNSDGVITAQYDVPFTTSQATFQLISPKDNVVALATKVSFAVKVPEQLSDGQVPRRATYLGKAQVHLGNLLRADLPFQLRLDGLSAEFPCLTAQQERKYQREQLPVPKPAAIDKIELVQLFDSPATAIVRLRCDSLREAFKFNPKLLRVTGAALASKPNEKAWLTNAEFRDLVPAPEIVSAILDTDGALKVELRLPAVRNAYPGSPYAGELTFSYQDKDQQTDFGEIKLPIVLKYVDPQAIILKSPQ